MAKRREPTTSSDPFAKARAQVARAIAEGEARAKHFLATAPRCSVCGKQMITKGLMHSACDPTSIAGKRCTCPPDCSDRMYGDGPRACDPECQVCRIMRGQALKR